MADTKISDLSAVTDVLTTDEFVLARAGATKKIAGASLLARPSVRALRAASQSVAASTEVAIQFNETDGFDTDGFHDPASNNTRITIPTGLGGLYMLIGDTTWSNNTTGERVLYLKKNGTTYLATVTQRAVTAFGNSMQIMALIELSAGDYMELPLFQNSGSTLTVTESTFSAVRL